MEIEQAQFTCFQAANHYWDREDALGIVIL